jgi:hypothetical protein
MVSGKEEGVKSAAVRLIKLFCLLLLASPAYGQGARIRISTLDHLSDRASETVDVAFEGPTLRFAATFLSFDNSPKIKDLIAGWEAVYVKSFEFDGEGQYSEADLELVRAEVRGPQWARVELKLRDRTDASVECYVNRQGGKTLGVAILGIDATHLAIVNIIGPVDLDRFNDLADYICIPGLGPQRKSRKK